MGKLTVLPKLAGAVHIVPTEHPAAQIQSLEGLQDWQRRKGHRKAYLSVMLANS